MSAYLQSNDHFNVLASYFTDRVHDKGMWCKLGKDYTYLNTPEQAETVFWLLVNENTRSLQARYPQSPDMWENAKSYKFKYIPNAKQLYSVGEIAKAIDGLEYQSCEADNHEDTEAYLLTRQMQKHLLTLLEDYEMAETWSIDQVKVKEFYS